MIPLLTDSRGSFQQAAKVNFESDSRTRVPWGHSAAVGGPTALPSRHERLNAKHETGRPSPGGMRTEAVIPEQVTAD